MPDEVIARDDWWMLVASLALFPAMRTGTVGRPLAVLLLLGFALYTAILVASAL